MNTVLVPGELAAECLAYDRCVKTDEHAIESRKNSEPPSAGTHNRQRSRHHYGEPADDEGGFQRVVLHAPGFGPQSTNPWFGAASPAVSATRATGRTPW